MQRRTRIQWTETARQCLQALPREAQKTAYGKVQRLSDCDDPRSLYKPLSGALAGVYSIRCGRYRVLYVVHEEELSNGDVLCTVLVRVVYAGQRKAGDRKDVYALAKRLISFAGNEFGRIAEDKDDQIDS